MGEDVKFGVLILSVVSMCFGLVIGTAYVIDSARCSRYAQQTGRNTEHFLFGGCYVEYNGKKIPYDEFKARAVTNEERE